MNPTSIYVLSLFIPTLPVQMEVEVTAYCPCKICCGPKACGITADGSKASGKIIAAPKTYPYGTKIFVPGWGWGVVHDRGGAIRSAGSNRFSDGKKGKLTVDRLDILLPTHKLAREWGRKRIVVTMIVTPPPSARKLGVIVTKKIRADPKHHQ